MNKVSSRNRCIKKSIRYPKRGIAGYNYMNKGKRGKKKISKWIGLKPDPMKNFGFVYKVVDPETGNYYLGKKQYWSLRPKATRKHKTPNTSLDSQHFNENYKESDWEDYITSSRNKEFKKLVSKDPNRYEWHIIYNCRTKGLLYYLENFFILFESWYLTDEKCLNGHCDKFYKPTEETKEIINGLIEQRGL